MRTAHPFNPSLQRQRLLLGGDRVLMLVLMLACVGVALAVQTRPAIAFAVFLWGFGSYALRLMGRHDPLLRNVYRDHARHRSFYTGRGFRACVVGSQQ